LISTDPFGKTALTFSSPPRAWTTCRRVLTSMSSRRSRRETFDWAMESRWASSEENAIWQPLDSICQNDRSASPEQVVSLPRNGWPTFVGEVLEARSGSAAGSCPPRLKREKGSSGGLCGGGIDHVGLEHLSGERDRGQDGLPGETAVGVQDGLNALLPCKSIVVALPRVPLCHRVSGFRQRTAGRRAGLYDSDPVGSPGDGPTHSAMAPDVPRVQH